MIETTIVTFELNNDFNDWVKIFDGPEAVQMHAEFDIQPIYRGYEKTNRSKVIVIHEDNLTNGPGAEISALIADKYFELLDGPVRRVAAKDSPVPFNWLLEEKVLPQTEDIVSAIEELLEY